MNNQADGVGRMRNYRRRITDNKISFRRKAISMLVTIPTAILVASFVIFFYRESILTVQGLSTLNIAFYILALVGMALSAGFNRSRIFFILMLLVLSQFVMASPIIGRLDDKTYYGVIYYFSCMLLPLNILLFSLLHERGPFTLQGKRRFGIILVQLLLVAVVIASQDQDMLGYIRQELLTQAFSLKTPLPAKALAVFLAGALVLLVRQLSKFSPVDNAFFHTLIVVAVGLHFKDTTAAISLFYTAAVAMLTVAAIQDSYAIAYRDELTGLPSRRALQEELAKLSDKYTVAMLDIDYFKKINDKYGHDVGDEVLRFIASIISQETTGDGKAFRYGGEEFTVLFKGKSAEEALPCLEALRQKIAKRPFFLRGKKSAEKRLSVTMSIGVADQGTKPCSPEEVVKAADNALYRAKENGRNCVSG